MNWQSREDERVARGLEGAPLHGLEDRALVALAGRVREIPAETRLDATPEFRAALRARLLSEGAATLPHPRVPADVAAGAGQPPAAVRPAGPGGSTRPERRRHAQGPPARPGSRRRRRLVAAGLIAATMLSVSAVAVSAGALPGDPLYGLKRRVQGVEVLVARGDTDRGRKHLDLARTRVDELDSVGVRAQPGPVVTALEDMDHQTKAGVRLLSTDAVEDNDQVRLSRVSSWIGEQRQLLTSAWARIPASTQSRASDSLTLLSKVAIQLGLLGDAMRCNCVSTTPATALSPTTGAPIPAGPGGPASGTTGRAGEAARSQPSPSAATSSGPAATAPAAGPAPPAGASGSASVNPGPVTQPPQPPGAPAPTIPVPVPPLPSTPPPPPDLVTGVLGGLLGLLDLGP